MDKQVLRFALQVSVKPDLDHSAIGAGENGTFQFMAPGLALQQKNIFPKIKYLDKLAFVKCCDWI